MRQISGTAAIFCLLAVPVWAEPIRITGRIEPAGAAGARAELHSYPASQGAALATARPAADGSFVLTAPESGFYRVIVRADGRPELEHPLVPLVDETELPPVRLGGEIARRTERFPQWGPVEARTPSVPPGPERTGRVVDSVTREPIAGALVWQQSGDFFSWTRTGADGSFWIAAAEGRPLAAVAAGYARAVRPEVFPDAQPSLALKPAVVLTGRVTDAEDRPVAGAVVQVVTADPYPYYRGLRDLVSGFTREDGTFRLRGVPSRSMLQVGASAAGFAPAEQMATTGEPGQRPAPVNLVMGPGSSLTGRLVDAEGRPVAGAELLLRDLAALDAGLAASPEESRAVTDASGRFRFEHLAGGTRQLSAGSSAAVLSEVEIPGQPSSLDAGDVRLAPEAVAEIPMPEMSSRLLSVTSQVAAPPEPPPAPGRPVSGRVTDSQGGSVAGASLLLLSSAAGRVLRATSAADGSFEFPEVPDGSYRLAARAAGFADARPEEVRVAGAPVAGVALRLEPGGTVSGRILGLAEHELPRVQVTAWRDGVETLLPLRALASTEGEYRITGLPLGEWRITARRASSYLVEKTVRLTKPGEEVALDLKFPEGAALSGRVLLNGKPLADALVALGNAETDGRQARQTTTRSDGSFAISAVEPGSYRLLVLGKDVKHVAEVEIPQDGEMLILLEGGRSR